MAGNPLDLNAEIISSITPSPVEAANKTVENVLGQHYQFVTFAHLNPSPDEQVAMQQVGPTPNYRMKVSPIKRRQRIPNRTWSCRNYTVTHENGVFTLIILESRSFLGFELRPRKNVIHKTGGKNGLWRMISYLDNSNLPSDDKDTLSADLSAAAGKKIGEVIEENQTTGAFVSPLTYAEDYKPQVVPTGIVDGGYYESGYEWGNAIAELPNF